MIPLLKNHPHGQRRVEVKVGEHSIKNIKDASFNIEFGNGGTLNLEIVLPDVDLYIGDYHIKSANVNNWQTIEILKDNEIVHGVQSIYFDGKRLFMEIVHMWEEARYEDEFYEVEVNLD